MPRGRLITPWLVAQGMAQCGHVPPCCRDSCIVAVGGKAFPRGRFPTTGRFPQWAARSPGTGEPWAQSLAGCMFRLCVCPPWWPWLALWQ